MNISRRDGSLLKTKITKLFTFNGLKRTDTEVTQVGDIVAIAHRRLVFIRRAAGGGEERESDPRAGAVATHRR